MGTETVGYVAKVTQEAALGEFIMHTAPLGIAHSYHYVALAVVTVWAKRKAARKVKGGKK